MHPDIASIAAADRAAEREVDDVRSHLEERLRAERARLDRERAQSFAVAQAALESQAAALARDRVARVAARQATRAEIRRARRARADAATAAAIAVYLAIVRDGTEESGMPP